MPSSSIISPPPNTPNPHRRLPFPVSPWLSQHESITLDPPPTDWRCRRGPLAEDARTLRSQLNLPTDRPIIMSGHQAAIWHAGIAAKVLALDAAAARLNAATAWIVVDQDVGTPTRITYPALPAPTSAPSAARFTRAALDLTPAAPPDTITGMQPALAPKAPLPDRPASPSIPAAISRISAALAAHASAPSRALQTTRAALDLLAPHHTPAAQPTLLTALALSSTSFFARLVDELRRDPARAISAYNAAVSRHPHARLRPLRNHPSRGLELPLWRITPDGARLPAHANDLAHTPLSTLAPRALTMTALLRWGACDLFIHGLGGGLYDPVMEDWLSHWLGVQDLAPAVLASATRLLPLVDDPPPTPEDVAHARWAIHHARHNPAAAAPSPAGPRRSPTKVALVEAVRNARGPSRAARFRDLHDWLSAQRRLNAPALAALDARASQLAAHADLSAVVFDRTWPFPLLPPDSIASLRDQIHAALAPR